jgi:hypothetical protein
MGSTPQFQFLGAIGSACLSNSGLRYAGQEGLVVIVTIFLGDIGLLITLSPWRPSQLALERLLSRRRPAQATKRDRRLNGQKRSLRAPFLQSMQIT